MEINTIGIAIDGSKASLRALEMAEFLARGGNVEKIEIGYVMPTALALGNGVAGLPASAHEIIQQDAEDILSEATELLKDSPSTVEAYALQGQDITETLIRFFNEHDCDLIVMGSRGRGGVKGYLGSVSRTVLLKASCPVVIVKDDGTQGTN